MSNKKTISTEEQEALLKLLKTRFEKNKKRHEGIDWNAVQAKLEANPEKLWSLQEMEDSGGEPDVIGEEKGDFLFCDCAAESPKGRRSLCYDQEALLSRKDYPPKNNVIDLAKTMGIELLSEEQYRHLHTLGTFDTKTSSWLKTPDNIRKLGGAIFGDFRFDTVFVYHNGAQSYYAGRGFRGMLKV